VATATHQPVVHPAEKPIERDAYAFAGRHSLLALWHLLSLDAPTVAALWTWFIARANHVALPFAAVPAMAIAVWMLYVADRLLDARLIRHGAFEAEMEARHYFHHRYRWGFLGGIVVASIALAMLLPHLDARAIRLYLVLGGLLAGYFVLIHAARNGSQTKIARRMPKEIAVGVFFAAAVFIPTVARRPELRGEMLPSAVLFAMLCSLNCLFIYAWEHPAARSVQMAHFATRFALCHLFLLSVGIFVAGLILAARQDAWSVPLACGLAAILLLVLHSLRRRFRPITLRAAADFVLLTPLLLLSFVR
jgi:hypothetical protein